MMWRIDGFTCILSASTLKHLQFAEESHLQLHISHKPFASLLSREELSQVRRKIRKVPCTYSLSQHTFFGHLFFCIKFSCGSCVLTKEKDCLQKQFPFVWPERKFCIQKGPSVSDWHREWGGDSLRWTLCSVHHNNHY